MPQIFWGFATLKDFVNLALSYMLIIYSLFSLQSSFVSLCTKFSFQRVSFAAYFSTQP